MPGVAAQRSRATLRPHCTVWLEDAVTDLAWDGQGRLYAGAADGQVCCYQPNGELEHSWQAHKGGVIRVRPQPGANAVATSGEDGQVRLWHADGTAPETLADESSWIEQLEWTPAGDVLAAAAEKTIYLWRGTESLGVWYDARRRVLAMAWAPDGKRLASASNKGLYLWRLGGQEPVQLLEFPGAPVSVAWKPDGAALAVGTQDGFLQIWRQRHGGSAGQMTMRGYQGKVVCVDWHPRRNMVATAGGRDVVLWDLSGRKGGTAQPLRHHERTVTRLGYAPDGSCLASGDRGGRLCLWNEAGQLQHDLDLGNEISAIRWCPLNRMLAVGVTDGGIHVYVECATA